MQFTVKNEVEYLTTVKAIIDANIYEEVSLLHALDIDDDVAKHLPSKYPCIVSIEIEESFSDNRRYSLASCKFIYKYDLLDGYEYQAKLEELDNLDIKLSILLAQMETSGIINKPTTEIEETRSYIELIEKQLF
ncbi:MAG: hypothetical protein GY707_05555 [Desulfobacteraceae bacterium]|nr:hypothetical protein [Desulfobacteraceae bacterium]